MNLVRGCALAAGAWLQAMLPAPAGPSAKTIIDVSTSTIGIRESLSDRAFTTLEETYDSHSFALLTVTRHASCCGSSWDSNASRNGDGTYSVDNRRSGPFATYTERLDRERVSAGDAIVTGNQVLAPAMLARGARQILLLAYEPIRLIPEAVINPPSDIAAPRGVPAGDRALREPAFEGGLTTVLWYNPCTFRVDAVAERG